MRTFSSLLFASLVLVSAARGQTVETIFSFPNDDSLGEYPSATLTVGPGGHLYGTTIEGGEFNGGTAFKYTTGGVFTLLGSFDAATTGRKCYSRMIGVGDGFLYGVNERNTGTSGDPNGTLFKVSPEGGISVVFQLPGSGATPKFPRALLQVEDGAIRVLGSQGPAGFWKVPLGGEPRTSFELPSNTVGAFAYSATLGSNGLIYGTTTGVSFVGTDPVLRGTIFRVAPDGDGLVKLHDCAQATGTTPNGAMVQASDGNFYGTMSAGGSAAKGCVFRLTPDGDYSVIHHFNGLSTPMGDLMQATDGFLYGTAQYGGSGLGGVFRVSLTGQLTVLHNFNGVSGTRPVAGLTQAPDGNLYGVVAEGGAGGKGAIFRVKLSLPPPNRAPVALDDIGVTTNTPVVIDVLANDFDPESGALTVSEVGTPANGTVTILSDNTIEYVPGGTFAGSDSFTYKVADPSGLKTEATVTIRSEPVGAVVFSGVFNGLVNLDPDLADATDTPRAQLVVAVSTLGKFTGVMLTGRKRVPIRGVFDLEDGTAVARVTLPGRGKAVLFLGFRADEPGSLVALAFGREIWSGGLRPAIPGSVANLGKHTVALEASTPGMPAGVGFGVMQVKANGLVTCVGKHGDGTKLTWGTTLVSATDDAPLIPVFSEPVAGGVSAGVLDSRVATIGSFFGEVRWIRPPAKRATLPYSSGFAGDSIVVVSPFVPADSLSVLLNFGVDAGGSMRFEGGPLVNPIDCTFAVAGPPPPPLRVVPAAPLKALTFNRKTGLFTGKVLNGTKVVNFSGVVLQGANVGFGQILIGGTTAAVGLVP